MSRLHNSPIVANPVDFLHLVATYDELRHKHWGGRSCPRAILSPLPRGTSAALRPDPPGRYSYPAISCEGEALTEDSSRREEEQKGPGTH